VPFYSFLFASCLFSLLVCLFYSCFVFSCEGLTIKDDQLFAEKYPRERIVSFGVKSLSDSELISVILGSGSRLKSVFLLAKELDVYLKSCPKFPELSELSKITGLGRAKACQILACLELSSRFLLGGQSQVVTNPVELLPRLAFLKRAQQECMVCVSLNGGSRVVGVHTLTVGLANQTQIHPREAFSQAILENAVSVIFAHNHPSGNTHPSRDDLDVTSRLVDSGRILDIPVLDHLIITPEGWSSIKALHPNIFSTT